MKREKDYLTKLNITIYNRLLMTAVLSQRFTSKMPNARHKVFDVLYLVKNNHICVLQIAYLTCRQ